MTLAPQFVWKCVNCSMRVATHGDLHVNERPLCVQCNAEMEPYQPGDDSEPSLSGRINALPDWARQHIHDIETRCDPAGDVRTIGELRDTIRALEKCGVSLEVYQHDWTPGFAAFMDDGRIAQGAPAHVSLNLGRADRQPRWRAYDDLRADRGGGRVAGAGAGDQRDGSGGFEVTFTIVTSCDGGHGQRFALTGCSRAWVDQMVGLLDGGACHQCGGKVSAEVHDHRTGAI